MLIDELDIPQWAKDALRERGYESLYPPQEEAVRRGVLGGRSLVLATPTASGKTLVAILAAAKHLDERRGKVVYLVPLKALASEKAREFSLFEERGFRVVTATGDFDDPAEHLGRADVIVATYEKMDSILRHKPSWLRSVSLVVVDEAHYIHSVDRGPTLEVLVTKLRRALEGAQMLVLSATIANAEEFQRWIGAEVVNVRWRPVPLKEGVFTNYTILYSDGSTARVRRAHGDPVVDMALETVDGGGQVLVFVPRRRDAVSTAKKIATFMGGPLGLETAVTTVGERILRAGEVTELSRELAAVARRGVAFHHAGLSYEHRSIVEEAFRDGELKVVVATPTLAAGVNLPARRVIITYLYRYELGFREPITVFEYKQMAGRAGRPRFDEYGEAILLAKSSEEAEYMMEEYVRGEPEPIRSKLLDSQLLEAHILGLLASEGPMTQEDVEAFFSSTLCGVQEGPGEVARHVSRGLRFLVAHELVAESGGRYRVTHLGRRVAELYILPATAVAIREMLSATGGEALGELDMLYVVCSTPDSVLAPLYSRDRRLVEERLREHIWDLRMPVPEEYSPGFGRELQVWKTALVLHDWISEVSEAEIVGRWRVEPGDLQAIRSCAEWIAYSAGQIARMLGMHEAFRAFDKLSRRIRHGVKEELLDLVSIEGVGRIRARALYARGYRTREDLRRATVEELMRIPGIGEKLARRLVGEA